MRPRRIASERRSLTVEERAELLAMIAAVPDVATVEHPAVVALDAYTRRLNVPWRGPWARTWERLAFGDLEGALHGLRRLAACLDWGETFSPPWERCGECERCVRRKDVHKRLGVYRTHEESVALGIVGCDATDMTFDDDADPAG